MDLGTRRLYQPRACCGAVGRQHPYALTLGTVGQFRGSLAPAPRHKRPLFNRAAKPWVVNGDGRPYRGPFTFGGTAFPALFWASIFSTSSMVYPCLNIPKTLSSHMMSCVANSLAAWNSSRCSGNFP